MAVTPAAMLGAAAIHSATSGGTSSGGSSNSASSFSRVYGTEANNIAAENATSANRIAEQMWEKAAAYNAAEAEKTRKWQENMANTVYQRTVKDMIAAGINPVLAANMGLGTANVSSGATASMGNPMSYMANTYTNSESASQSEGSSWNQSLSGLAYLADAISGAISAMNSSHQISIAIDGLKDLIHTDVNNDGETKADEAVANVVSEFTNKTPMQILDMFTSTSSGRKKSLENSGAYDYTKVPSYGRINEASWGSGK